MITLSQLKTLLLFNNGKYLMVTSTKSKSPNQRMFVYQAKNDNTTEIYKGRNQHPRQ